MTGASLEVAALQDFDPDVIAVVNRDATLGADAQLRWALASLGAQLHRSRIDNRLVGRGSTVHQAEIGFGRGSQLFDLTSYTRHVGTDTTGDLLSKGVFTDRSRGYIKGLIEITRAATGTDSYLGEFGMLLTKRSRSVTIPSLEIDQPNVRRAAHSSSVGPIDEAQVFYLMSRGVDREAARRDDRAGVPRAGRRAHPPARRSRSDCGRCWRPAGPTAGRRRDRRLIRSGMSGDVPRHCPERATLSAGCLFGPPRRGRCIGWSPWLQAAAIGLLGILIGLAFVFWGFRLFLILLPIWGFFVGFLFGASVVHVLHR